jgi:hypothetical protein
MYSSRPFALAAFHGQPCFIRQLTDKARKGRKATKGFRLSVSSPLCHSAWAVLIFSHLLRLSASQAAEPQAVADQIEDNSDEPAREGWCYNAPP